MTLPSKTATLELPLLVENDLIDFYREEQGPASYGQLYLIAHELDRHAHTLRDVAGLMEGRYVNEDLFDEF